MMPTPFLILSDSPTAKTGLGRITRDIATRMHAHMSDVFRVGTVGYGGPFSSSLGFMQYPIDMENWIISNLPDVWNDFSQGQPGVLFTIWDASRLQWLMRPEMCGNRRLRDFLNKRPFQTWAYWPVDATGVNDRLTQVLGHTMDGADRSLAYSKWAEGVMRKSMEKTADLTFLPHGIETDKYFPRKQRDARHAFGQRMGARYVTGKKQGQFISIPDDALFIGVVGTNQVRKDWGLAMAVIAGLAKQRPVRAWLHTDVLDRYWSIPNLIYDFGLRDSVIVTIHEPDDEQMSWAYAACDVTLGIGLGEGFGFCAAESLACGTPVIAPNYGGGEFIPKEFLIDPIGSRLEGQFNCVRPVMEPDDFVDRILALPKKTGECLLPKYIHWDELWPCWERWLREGIQ